VFTGRGHERHFGHPHSRAVSTARACLLLWSWPVDTGSVYRAWEENVVKASGVTSSEGSLQGGLKVNSISFTVTMLNNI